MSGSSSTVVKGSVGHRLERFREQTGGDWPSARCRARNEEAGLVRGRHRQSRFVIQCPFSPTSKSSSVIIARTARLTGDATAVARNGYLLTAACPCGVVDRAVSDANGRRRRSVRRTEGYQELNRAMRAFLVPIAGAVLIVLVGHLVRGKP